MIFIGCIVVKLVMSLMICLNNAISSLGCNLSMKMYKLFCLLFFDEWLNILPRCSSM